jgi:hypothetical protein
MGRWRGDTFKEYVRKELHCFSDGMAKAMKQCFKFVNLTGHALMDITSKIVNKKNEINEQILAGPSREVNAVMTSQQTQRLDQNLHYNIDVEHQHRPSKNQ